MTIPQRIPNASRTGHCAIPAAVAFEQGSPPSATADCRCWDAALSTLACGHRLRRLSALTKPHPSSPLGHRAFDGQKGCRALSRARLVPTCASEPAEKGLSISSVEGWAKSPAGWEFSSEEFGRTPALNGYPMVLPVDVPNTPNLTWTVTKP